MSNLLQDITISTEERESRGTVPPIDEALKKIRQEYFQQLLRSKRGEIRITLRVSPDQTEEE